jgi:hypothetical protein
MIEGTEGRSMSTSARLAILMAIAACAGPDGATSPNLADSLAVPLGPPSRG